MAESKSAHCNLTEKIANLNIFDECLKLDFAQKDKAATAGGMGKPDRPVAGLPTFLIES